MVSSSFHAHDVSHQFSTLGLVTNKHNKFNRTRWRKHLTAFKAWHMAASESLFLNKTSFQIQMNQIHCCKKNVYEVDVSTFRSTWWVGWNVLNNFDVRKVAWQYSDLSIRLADLSRRSLGEWPLFWRLFVWQLVSIDSRRYFDDPRIWITELRRAPRKKSVIVNNLKSTII